MGGRCFGFKELVKNQEAHLKRVPLPLPDPSNLIHPSAGVRRGMPTGRPGSACLTHGGAKQGKHFCKAL